jgi:hypothetical protein
MKSLKIILVLATVFSTLALAAPAHAATGTIGSYRAGKIGCGTFPGRHIEIGNPQMYAVNTTANVDRQWVAYKPVVFRWNGTSWVQYSTDGWMQGNARDNASPTSWFDAGTQEHYAPIAKAINVPAGYYKVAMRYHWYATSRVGSGSDYRWVPRYTAENGTVSTSYCTIP